MKLVVLQRRVRRDRAAARSVTAPVLVRALALIMAATAATIGSPAGAAAAEPTPSASATVTPTTATPLERVSAIIAPATLYVEVHWEGWVRSRATSELIEPESIGITTRCTGFAVSGDGYLVTAGHCVNPTVIGTDFFAEVARRRVRAGTLDQDQADALATELLASATVDGRRVGEPAERRVLVQRGVAQPDDTSSPEAVPAQVVSVVVDGDIALLKVERTNQPIVRLVDRSDPPSGLAVVAAGYLAPAAGRPLEPVFHEGRLGYGVTENAVPFCPMTAATTAEMDGGPVANPDGEVVGAISRGPSARVKGFDYLVASSAIVDELDANEVKNDLGDIDTEYRDGLKAYFDGRYGEAIQHLDAVLALMPSHAQAQDYRQRAVGLREVERTREAEQPQDRTLVRTGMGGVVVLVLLAGAAGLLVLRRRRTIKEPTAVWYCTNCSVGSTAGTQVCPTCGHRFP